MPRLLYLMRHAQSAEKQNNQTDFERELTASGMRQSVLIGNFIAQKNFPVEILYCSPAVRAKATANFVGEACKLDPDRIHAIDELYDASTRTLFNFIAQLGDELQHVMLVGHNPAVTYLAEHLTKEEISEIVPAGMVIIKFRFESWKELSEGSGELLSHIGSDMLTP